MLIPILLILILFLLAFLAAGIFPTTLFLMAFLLSTAALYVSIRANKESPTGHLHHLILILIILLTITIIPLPAPFNSLMNAQRASQNTLAENATHKAVDIGIVDPFSPRFSITRNRSGTIRMILLLVCTFTTGALSSRIVQEKKMFFIQCIVILGVLMATAGFISQWVIPQGKSIWWTFTVPHGTPVGCFINRNHFGGYLAMLAPSALVLAVTSCTAKKMRSTLLWLSALTIISFAIISSLSRGAWLAWFLSMLATGTFLAFRAKSKKLLIAIACVMTISLPLALGIASRKDVTERLTSFNKITSTESAQMRFTTWKDSLKIAPHYPLLGTGANGFRMVFPQYRTLSSRKEFKHTENEYLQIPIETGLAGTLLIIAILASAFQRWRKERDPNSLDEAIINTCIIGAITATAVHALLDFTIRVPLYAITLTALAGLALKPAVKHPDDKRRKGLSSQHCFLLCLALTLIIALPGGINTLRLDSPDHIKHASASELCNMLTYSPGSWQTWYHLGNKSITSGLPGSYKFGEECITQATHYDPLNYRLWTQLCRVRLFLEDIEGAKIAYKRLKKLRSWITIEELELLDEK